jgi:hypothetical protein
MIEIFFIPNNSKRDNIITNEDIKKGYLRITKDNQKYFPYENKFLKINIDGKQFDCKLYLNNDSGRQRSYHLILKKEGMDALNIDEGDSVKVTKISDFEYFLKKKGINEEKIKAQQEFKEKFCQK